MLAPFADAEVLEVLGASTRARSLIVLADDSPLIHRAHRAHPRGRGLRGAVMLRADGAEALELIRARRPDLVITDVEMPRLDGYGLSLSAAPQARGRHRPPAGPQP
ncbi:MAG: response regulator [Kofleriaceae bacterium]|nr:response regulator [Kofleriaceae bacterium]